MEKKTVKKIAIGAVASAALGAIAYHVIKEKMLIDSFEDDLDFEEESEEEKIKEPRKYTKILSRKQK